jgi:hypothetical protein
MHDDEQKLVENIDFSRLLPCDQIIGDDPEDTALLNAHRKYAEEWLSSFRWCKGVKECFFGCGLGGVIAVFLMAIEPGSEDVDEYLWVVVGDVPSAYLVTEDAPTPAKALEVYCVLMQDWVDAVRAGKSVGDLIPVNAAPTLENADALQTRLTTLQQLEIPERPEILRAGDLPN